MDAYQIAVNHRRNFPSSDFFDKKRLESVNEGLATMRVLNSLCLIRTRAGAFVCFQICSTVRGSSNPNEHRYHYFDLNFNWIATKENKK